jgi:hypothetical protein
MNNVFSMHPHRRITIGSYKNCKVRDLPLDVLKSAITDQYLRQRIPSLVSEALDYEMTRRIEAGSTLKNIEIENQVSERRELTRLISLITDTLTARSQS